MLRVSAVTPDSTAYAPTVPSFIGSAAGKANQRSYSWFRVFRFAIVSLVCAFAPPVAAQNAPLILLSESTSTRAIGFDSITFTKEPFSPNSLISWSADRRTRVVLFALNLQPTNGDLSTITADAEDGAHRHYDLKVEYAGLVPGQEWMSAITLRLSDDLTDVGDVLVRIVQSNRQSNRVRIAIGHVGGGLADDAGSKPTSPLLIRGNVTGENSALGDAVLTLLGNGSEVSTKTNTKGEYIIGTIGGDYTLSAAKTFFDFSPLSRSFVNLVNALDGVNFSATRQKRTVSVVVRDDNGAALPNIDLTMTGSDSSVRKVTTNAAGSFTFTQILAGFSYTVTPTNSSVFAFTSQTIDPLAESTALSFSGVRRLYSISGHVLEGNAGIANATVRIQGTNSTSITDAAGNFTLPEIRAGFDYTITVTKDEYVFENASVLVSGIDSDRQINFKGNPYVFLTGRIVDQDGRGVFGAKVDVSGTQSGTATTAADGRYSFLVTAFGNYSLRAWKEQDYYSFTPNAVNLTALKGSRTADFNGTFASSVSPSHVLEFDGAAETVDYSMTLPGPDYNLFWPDGEDFGHFFWEFWAMPGENAGGTYMISDGYGGAHAILFGVSTLGAREPNRYQLLGNIWNGSFITYFSSDEGPAPNEWGHFAAGWDGANIVVYFDGVPVGKTPWVGPRITPGGIQGCGRLLIGGSDHSNFVGRIAQVRGYERNNPHEAANVGVFASFAPQTVFAVDANLLSYFFRPAETVADLSLLGQYGRQHTGLLRSTANGVLYPCAGCPIPQFVVDPTAPDFAHPNNPGTVNAPVDAPGAVPGGALIFDSFSRRNSTYILGGLGGLNLTEAGSAGPKPWLTSAAAGQSQPFGILNGRAVLLANSAAVTWINLPASSANLDIRVERHPGVWSTGVNTGLSFRVADANNYFYAYTSDDPDPSEPQTLTLGYYSNGVRTQIATGVSLPTTWITLRVVTKDDGTINVYAANTLVYSTNNSLLAGSPGAGLYNNGPGLALTNRWDNFSVFAAP